MSRLGLLALCLCTCGLLLLPGPVQADVLETAEPNQVFHGRLESETEGEVVFRVRYYSGETESREFKKTNVQQLVVTVDQNDLAAFATWDVPTQFEYCETLAASSKDLEIQWVLASLLSAMQERQLEPKVQLAVDRLLATSVSVGPALLKLKQQSIEDSDLQTRQQKLNQQNGDWQSEFIRPLTDEDRKRLREIVVQCRQDAQWKTQWKELRQRVQFVSSTVALERMDQLLSEGQLLPPDLLRFELLLSGVSVERLGPPSWPVK